MAMRYGYFDSEITGVDSEGMPIFDRAETSELFRLLFSKLLTNGVLAKPADCFKVLAGDTGLSVKVQPGFGLINGAFAYDPAPATFQLAAAPTSYSRIDRVVLRCNYLERLCEIIIKTGTAASNPTAPELIRPVSGDYYELGLALVTVGANQSVITQSSITDTRPDSSVCGYITQFIDSIDTETFYDQFNAFYAEFVTKSNADLTAITESMKEFQRTSQDAFNEWFATVQGLLDEDVAGKLIDKTNSLDERLGLVETSAETLKTEVTGLQNNMLEVQYQITHQEDFFENIVGGGAAFHNAIPRGKKLDADLEQYWANIKNGGFKGMYVGDYWEIDGVIYRIAGFNYYYKCGACTRNHVVIVPDKCLYTSTMDDVLRGGASATGKPVELDGGYGATTLKATGLDRALEMVKAAFGSDHILTHTVYLVNKQTSGVPSGGAGYSSQIDLMSEEMVYGTGIFRPTSDGKTVPANHRMEKTQLPLFRYDPSKIVAEQAWWLRDLVAQGASYGNYYATVLPNGNANASTAQMTLGVRPAFCIYAP